MQERSTSGSCAGLTDAELAAAYAAGSESAFAVLADRYINLIRSLTSKFRVSGLERDDLVQEGMMGLMNAAKSYSSEGGASFKTYAALCVSRRVISILKQSRGGKGKAMSDYISFSDETLALLSDGLDPEEMYIDKESLVLLTAAAEEILSSKEKQVLQLYMEGMTYEEIAAYLNINRKSVDNAMQRIRKKLRAHISGITL
ncbi:MAG: sigma-70 family RNA polymerase sigma factor [Clostridia bacterium]|nr:sigma-70 family RNA polymerase sigma factor [Clostridia bacterium]